MKTEHCILDIRANPYFFHCSEQMVDDYLSVHKADCKEDNKPVWLFKKTRQVGEWQ